jgi:hypothetical protein
MAASSTPSPLLILSKDAQTCSQYLGRGWANRLLSLQDVPPDQVKSFPIWATTKTAMHQPATIAPSNPRNGLM